MLTEQVKEMLVTHGIRLATNAANEAGKEWLGKATPKFEVHDAYTGKSYGTMLDNCGNAHVCIKDKRTANYKLLKRLGYVRGSNGIIEINHNYRSRQEHGLLLVCAEAAKKVLTEAGFDNLVILDYID
jgi:hypothetical protein